MYSLLMMTALAAGPDTNAFGGKHWGGGCCGGYVSCYGCCGYSYGCCGYSYGCCGYSYGCCGYSYGCCGGYSYGCCGGLFHGHKHHNYSYGCCGGYSYGCCGGYPMSYGYGGCCGGAYGGCYGSWYGSYYGAYSPGGCFGYGIVTGGPSIVSPGIVTPTIVGGTTIVGSAADVGQPVIPPAAPSTTTVERPASSPARLTIELPATAKLIVDGRATKGDGVTRQFHTPPLPAGQAFYYEMRAEVEVDGKVEVEEKRVVVRAGQSLTESFAKLSAATAGAKATSVAAAK